MLHLYFNLVVEFLIKTKKPGEVQDFLILGR
jgi:hypothetical protein